VVSAARSSLLEKLEFLYPGKGGIVEAELRIILDEFESKHPAAPAREPFFSERDAVLICYADHVQEPNVKTLRTLDSFLCACVRDLIPAVHILPFFPYSSDDGFSVIDYVRVKEEYGNWADVDRIADDFDLMVDLVINHVSAESEWFRRFVAGDPAYADYFIAFDHPVDVSSVFRPRTHPLLTPVGTANGVRYVWTTFSEDQIDVNFNNPDVLLQYIRILLFYVEHGARVIRLDAIAFLWKELGTTCIHLTQTHIVVKLLRQVLERVAPSVWLITETNVPHKDNISYFGNGDDEAHLVYNFALPPLVLYSLLRGNTRDLTRWATTLAPPSSKTAFFNFTASHDGIGVTALGELVSPAELDFVVKTVRERGGRIGYRSVPGQEPVPYELNIVYLDAVGGADAFIASQAIALSLQGVPGIYFNSLVGARNWKEGVESLGYNRAINRQKCPYAQLSAELADPSSTKHQVYEAYARLLKARRSEASLGPSASQRILDLHPQLFAVLRFSGKERLLALTNVSEERVRLETGAMLDILGTDRAQDLLTGEERSLEDGLDLAAYGIAWLKPGT
jgi:glycosidase